MSQHSSKKEFNEQVVEKLFSLLNKKTKSLKLQVREIIEIGSLLQKAYDYFDTGILRTTGWTDFLKTISLTKTDANKYLTISSSPTLNDKKVLNKLPASLDKLVKLSKLSAKELEKTLNSKSLDSVSNTASIKRSSQSSQPIDESQEMLLLQVYVSKDNWMQDFESVLQTVTPILDTDGVNYSISTKVTTLKNTIDNYEEKIEKKSFALLKNACQKMLNEKVEAKLQPIVPKNKLKRMTWKEKYMKAGYNLDEVDLSIMTSQHEIKNVVFVNSFFDGNWDAFVFEMYMKAKEQVRKPKSIVDYENALEKINDTSKREDIESAVNQRTRFENRNRAFHKTDFCKIKV